MLEWMFGDFTMLQIAVMAVGAIIIGINKTAIPALGALAVVMFTQFFDPATASAAVLPLLCGIRRRLRLLLSPTCARRGRDLRHSAWPVSRLQQQR